MTFNKFNFHAGINKAIEESGFTTPTLIQEEAIPKILSGLDICASAQTGSGKTAAFLLPAIQRLMTPSASPGIGPRILILVPTRELAMQVAAEAERYSKFLTKVKTVCIYGGAPYPLQNRQLSRHYEILVATPGRLIDHLERGKIDFSKLELLVLDEADRMLDMGFIGPVEQIADETPKNRQTLMFSATFKPSVVRLASKLLNNPIEIKTADESSKHENIEQRMLYSDNLNHKNDLLDHLLNDTSINQAIVFTSTKRHADELVDKLREYGHHAAAMHGDMNQGQRTRTIKRLREGEIRVLVATDVAARGIDVTTITHVINFDLPRCVEDYVHRIGRTGRAQAKGVSISFVANGDIPLIRQIEKLTGQKANFQEIPGLEPKVKHHAPMYERRGPSSDRRGSFSDRRGPPSDRRGPPSADRRGPPSDRRGPPSADRRGPAPRRHSGENFPEQRWKTKARVGS